MGVITVLGRQIQVNMAFLKPRRGISGYPAWVFLVPIRGILVTHEYLVRVFRNPRPVSADGMMTYLSRRGSCGLLSAADRIPVRWDPPHSPARHRRASPACAGLAARKASLMS